MIVPKRAVEGEVKAYFIYGYHAMTFLCTFSWERVGLEGKMIVRLYAWVRLGIGRNIIPVQHTFKLKRQCPVRQQVSLRETHEIIAFASMASLSIQQTLDRRNLFDEGRTMIQQYHRGTHRWWCRRIRLSACGDSIWPWVPEGFSRMNYDRKGFVFIISICHSRYK